MLKKVEAFIRQQALLASGDTVLVACSGGPDSLALLDMLLQLRRTLGISVQAAHFEHGIRGEASRADAAFVKAFCRERRVPFFLESADVPALGGDPWGRLDQLLGTAEKGKGNRFSFHPRKGKKCSDLQSGGCCHCPWGGVADNTSLFEK